MVCFSKDSHYLMLTRRPQHLLDLFAYEVFDRPANITRQTSNAAVERFCFLREETLCFQVRAF